MHKRAQAQDHEMSTRDNTGQRLRLEAGAMRERSEQPRNAYNNKGSKTNTQGYAMCNTRDSKV